MSWEAYLNDCGRDKYLENNLHARHLFVEKYRNNAVNWRGAFVFMKPEIHDNGFIHFYQVYIKMIPTDSTEIDVIMRFDH
jgi:hypothetical protein